MNTWLNQCHFGDCLEVMRGMPDNCVDSIVTDPPYGLSFMGKKWDYDVPSEAIWSECLRVLKPGGHLLAFAGTRTQHRMACRIEDAGFDIRDMIAWVYGSGFPKSLDVSKAIDKAAGADRLVLGTERNRGASKAQDGKQAFGDYAGEWNITAPSTESAQQWQGWGTALKPAFEPLVVAVKPILAETELDIISVNLLTLEARLWSLSLANAAEKTSMSNQNELSAACAIARWTVEDCTNTRVALCAQTDMSQFELATNTSLSIVSSWRNTLAEVSKHGSTSTTRTKSNTTTCWTTLSFCLLQITPGTIITGQLPRHNSSVSASNAEKYFNAELKRLRATLELSALEFAISQDRQNSLDVDASVNHEPICVARKPLAKGNTVAANVLHWGTGALNIDACRVGAELVEAGRAGRDECTSDAFGKKLRAGGAGLSVGRWPANLIHDGSDEVLDAFPESSVTGKRTASSKSAAVAGTNWLADNHESTEYTDTGSAARFFYCAKASREDRDKGNNHPTVKPTDLMRYLCRLVTPPGGIVLDPFMGSGSTGCAALLEGFKFVGIERDAEYIEIARARVDSARRQGHQPSFEFAEAA